MGTTARVVGSHIRSGSSPADPGARTSVCETVRVLAISRFRYDEDLTEQARTELGLCLEHLATRPGFATGMVGRALDDPAIWVLTTAWDNVGAYRRALSSYEIKMYVVPLLARAIDELSAYEVIIGEGATTPNAVRPRGQ